MLPPSTSLQANGTGGCKHSQAKKLGDVTTLNLTMLKAGVTGDGGETWNLNVIPVCRGHCMSTSDCQLLFHCLGRFLCHTARIPA